MASNKTAVELLEMGDGNRQPRMLNKIWPYLMGGGFGIASGCCINMYTRRPLFSGIQKHITAVVVSTAICVYINKCRNEYFSERDAIFRHYISLHPEDFVAPERKKLSQVLEPWVPVR